MSVENEKPSDEVGKLLLRMSWMNALFLDIDQKLSEALDVFKGYDPKVLDPKYIVCTQNEFLSWLQKYMERSMKKIKLYDETEPKPGRKKYYSINAIVDGDVKPGIFVPYWDPPDSEDEEIISSDPSPGFEQSASDNRNGELCPTAPAPVKDLLLESQFISTSFTSEAKSETDDESTALTHASGDNNFCEPIGVALNASEKSTQTEFKFGF